MSSPLGLIWLLLSKCLKVDIANFVFKKYKKKCPTIVFNWQIVLFQNPLCSSRCWQEEDWLTGWNIIVRGKRQSTFWGKTWENVAISVSAFCHSNHVQVFWGCFFFNVKCLSQDLKNTYLLTKYKSCNIFSFQNPNEEMNDQPQIKVKSKPDTPLLRNESHSPSLFPKVWIDDEPKMDNMIYPKAQQALSNLEQGSENLHSSSCNTLCPRQRAFSDVLRVKAIQSTDGNIRFSIKSGGNCSI